MNNEKLTPTTSNPIKKSSSWDWIWPSIVGVIIVKLFGLVGGLVTIGTYYWLKQKAGTWVAVAISGVLGVVSAVGLSAMLGNVVSTSAEKLPIAASHGPISRPTLDSKGWTQESTGSTEIGPWLNYSPPGTRYCRYADRTIQRLYPPGVRPNLTEANPFCLGDSSESVPQ